MMKQVCTVGVYPLHVSLVKHWLDESLGMRLAGVHSLDINTGLIGQFFSYHFSSTMGLLCQILSIVELCRSTHA